MKFQNVLCTRRSALLHRHAPAPRRLHVEPLEQRIHFSRSYFVSSEGSATGTGSALRPFLTIQQAANAAKPGDSIIIHAGTYIESIRPARSGSPGKPIVYRPAGDGPVVINGGVDPSVAFMHPVFLYATTLTVNNGTAKIENASLPGGLVGQTIHIAPGMNWVWQTGTITESSPGQLTYSYTPMQGGFSSDVPTAGNPFYITDRVIPAVPDAFDFSGRSNIVVTGISLQDATIVTSAGSNNILLDNLNAIAVSAFDGQADAWADDTLGGIRLLGANDVIQNSTISDSSGNGVFVNGNNDAVLNCVIHDVDLSGGAEAGIMVYGQNAAIEGNTIYNAGRDGIKVSGAPYSQVIGNVIHDVMQLTTDGGAIYTFGTDGAGSHFDDNTLYNISSGGYGADGLYFDNGSSNYEASNNLIYNVQIPIKTNPPSTNLLLTNNTATAPGAAAAPAATLVTVPSIDLSGTFTSVPSTARSGGLATVILQITNNGTETAAGPLAIELGGSQLLRASGSPSAITAFPTISRPIHLAAGASARVRLTFRVPPLAAGAIQLNAQIDPGNLFAEASRSNQSVIAQAVTTIA